MSDTWSHIARAGVDSGMLWVGDPCYVLHRTPDADDEHLRYPGDLGRDWSGFCEKLDGVPHKSFAFDLGHEGLGVCLWSPGGDGLFDVEGRFDEDGTLLELRVVLERA